MRASNFVSRVLKATVAAALLMMALAPSARAQIGGNINAATTLQVTATVVTSCILSSTPINFGNIDPNLLATTPFYGNGAINIFCSSTATPAGTLTFDMGRNFTAAGTLAVATCGLGSATACEYGMDNGNSVLPYAIFTDPGLTNPINPGAVITPITTPVSTFTGSSPYVYPVYGEIGAQATPLTAGVYNDSIYVVFQ